MTKLKTLKDLIIENDENYLPQDNPIIDVEEYIDPEELREEVIKWIKEYNNQKKKQKIFFYNHQAKASWKYKVDETTIKWIKYFFNIEEEDLK